MPAHVGSPPGRADAAEASAACVITVVSGGASARECLVHLLRGQPGLDAAVDAAEAMPAGDAGGLERRVVVLDVRGSSEEAIAGLLERAAGSSLVLIASARDEGAETARAALRAGADAFVVAERLIDDLVPAIQSTIAGECFVSPTIGALLALGDAPARDDVLTERERAVLKLLGGGHTNAEAAGHLFVSQRTVEAHRAAVQRKLGISGRAELVNAARERGLI